MFVCERLTEDLSNRLVMSAAQYFSQPSYDMDEYFLGGVDLEEALLCQSTDFLTHSFDFEQTPSAHRNDLNIFEPIIDDINASTALTKQEPFVPNDNYCNQTCVNTYLTDRSSMVVPHIPKASKESTATGKSPLSPCRTNRTDIVERFIVFDATTGRERRPLLHEFIRMVLENDDYSHIAEYSDRRQDIFKLHKPKEIAELWKQVKGRNSDNRK